MALRVGQSPLLGFEFGVKDFTTASVNCDHIGETWLGSTAIMCVITIPSSSACSLQNEILELALLDVECGVW